MKNELCGFQNISISFSITTRKKTRPQDARTSETNLHRTKRTSRCASDTSPPCAFLSPVFCSRCFELRFGLVQWGLFLYVVYSSCFTSTKIGPPNFNNETKPNLYFDVPLLKDVANFYRNTAVLFGHSFSAKLDFQTFKELFPYKKHSSDFFPFIYISKIFLNWALSNLI